MVQRTFNHPPSPSSSTSQHQPASNLTPLPQVYNTTYIRWTTHSPRGLTDKDVILASLCDELAKSFGELPAEAKGADEAAAALVDRVAGEAGDCCVPKR
jgi:hypothetical protein